MTGPDRPHGADPADPGTDDTTTPLLQIWDRLIAEAIDAGNLELGAALAGAEVVPGEVNEVVLQVAIEHRAWLADGHPHRLVLEQRIRSHLGHLPNLRIQTHHGGSGDGTEARNQRYRAAVNRPLVQELLRRFDADVVAREPSDHDQFLARIDAGELEP